jgi:GTPase KRas protein
LQLCLNHFVETYDPTIEDSYRKQVVLDGQPATLEVLDTAGQEEYTALRDQWIREGECFLLVYSITSRSSFSRIRSFYNQIQRVKEDDDPFSVVIVGNKSDRDSGEREVSTQEGEALADELGGVPFFESSAKLNINIEAAFFECARQCKKLRARAAQEQQQQQAQSALPLQASQASQQQQQHSQDTSSLAYPDQYSSTPSSQHPAPPQTQQQPISNSQQAQVKSTANSTQSTGKPPKKKTKKDKCTIM